jgi:predicted metal-binding membrane protein
MYPNSDLSAGQLTIMAVVVVAVLAAWLIAVFLAARQPRDKSAAVSAGRRDEETAATVTQLPSDDKPSGQAAALSGITPRRGAPVPGMTAWDAGYADSAGHGRRRW